MEEVIRMITRDHGTFVKMTYMFLVAEGSVATIPSTSFVRWTWQPSREL
jgi:hypothetical protein